jgi:ankyrin repeat protein
MEVSPLPTAKMALGIYICKNYSIIELEGDKNMSIPSTSLDGSPINLDTASSRELNRAARKACGRNGQGTLLVAKGNLTYEVLVKKNWYKSPKIISARLSGRTAALSNAKAMDLSEKGFHLGAFRGRSGLTNALRQVDKQEEIRNQEKENAKTKVNEIMGQYGRRSTIASSDWEIIKNLIGSGLLDINFVGDLGSLLHMAVRLNNLAAVQYLVENGADVNISAEGRDSPVQVAIRCKKDPQIVGCLLGKSGIDTRKIGGGGEIPLETAIIAKNMAAFPLLLAKCKEQINIVNNKGQTPFMLAAKEGNLDAMKQMFEAGANINLRDSQGNTASMLAAAAGNRAAMEYLESLEGADKTLKNNDGLTASKILEKVENKKYDKEVLLELAGMLKPDMSQDDITAFRAKISTIKDKENLNMEYAEGRPVLLSNAVATGNREIVECLIDAGARIDTVNIYEDCPLTVAIASNDLNMLKFLFEKLKQSGVSRDRILQQKADMVRAAISGSVGPEFLAYIVREGIRLEQVKTMMGSSEEVTVFDYAKRNLASIMESLENESDGRKDRKRMNELTEAIGNLTQVIEFLESLENPNEAEDSTGSLEPDEAEDLLGSFGYDKPEGLSFDDEVSADEGDDPPNDAASLPNEDANSAIEDADSSIVEENSVGEGDKSVPR